MAEINPYQAPQASVADPGQPEGILNDEPRTVDAGRGLAWLSRGWSLFKQAALVWVAITVIGLVIFVALGFIPVLGQLATTLLSILFAGGLMLGCRALDRGEELTVAHLFAAFKTHLSPLLVVGALYLAGLFVVFTVVSLLSGGAAFAFMRGEIATGAAFTSIMLSILIGAAIMIPVAMATWFAPALITLHNLPPAEAMKASFRGCLRNILAFLVYGVIVFVLAILAAIPFGLGWLVLLPVLTGSVYAAYQDIFVRQIP